MNSPSAASRVLAFLTVLFMGWMVWQATLLNDGPRTMVVIEPYAHGTPIVVYWKETAVPTATVEPTPTIRPTSTPRPSCGDPSLSAGDRCWKATATNTPEPTPTEIPTPGMYPTPKPTPTPYPTYPGDEGATTGTVYLNPGTPVD